LSELIRRLMTKDAAERPFAAELVAEELAEIGRGLVGLPVQVIAIHAIPGQPDPWADLDTTQAGESKSHGPAPARIIRRASRWRWGVGAVLGAVAVVVLVWLAVQSLHPRPKAEVAEEPKPVELKKETPKSKEPGSAAPVFAGAEVVLFDGKDASRW